MRRCVPCAVVQKSRHLKGEHGRMVLIHRRFSSRQAWVCYLSNHELGEALQSAEDEFYSRPSFGVRVRLDMLSREIDRREEVGMWTEEDWLE